MSPQAAGRDEVRRDLALLAGGAALLFFVALGARDLWNPNEPTYGRAVVEMAERGDWLVPTVNGLVFAEKPILYFWLARLSAAALGGASEGALRVPSAAAGVLGVLLVHLLVVPYAGRRRGKIAAALFATTFLVFWGARSVQMDLLLAVAVLGTLLAATRALDHAAAPTRAWGWAGASAGLGFLAKGPLATILPAIVLVLYLATSRRLTALRSPAWGAGAAAFLLVVSPWLLALWARGELGLLHETLLRQNVTRFLDPWDHLAPWWYYGKYFWIDLAPWSWLVPLAVALPERDGEERRLDLLAWCWLAGVVLFFSLSPSKRSAYILPAAPAVAILASGPIERLLDHRLGRARRRVALALVAAAAGAAIAAGAFVLARVVPAYPEAAVPARGLAALLVFGGLAGWASVASKHRVPAAAASFVALLVSVYLVTAVVALPAADPYKSVRPFCERVRATAGEEGEVASFAFWDFRGAYGYYLGRTLPNLKTASALRAWWSRPERVFVIVEATALAEAREVIGERAPLATGHAGQNTAYLFANR